MLNRKRFFDLLLLWTVPLVAQRIGPASGLADLELDSLLQIPISASARYEQTVSEAPSSVTIITHEDILKYGYRSLDEVLRSVRGFYTSYDRNYAYVGVRGFGRPTDYNDRLLLLIDGHILNDNIYGSAAIGTDMPLDMNAVDRIEIVRGPNSTLYGTSAMFAVINIITRRGPAVNGWEGTVEVGSYGKWEGTAQIGKAFGNGSEIFLSGRYGDMKGQDLYFKEFDDPALNQGWAQGMDWERYGGFYGRFQHKGFTLQGIATKRDKGVPTGAWDVIFNDPRMKMTDRRQFVEARYDVDLSATKNWMTRLSVDDYHYQAFYPQMLLQSEDSHGIWWDAESQFRWDLTPGERLILGGKYQNTFKIDYRFWNDANDFFKGKFPYSMTSFYVQNEYQMFQNLMTFFGISRDAFSAGDKAVMPRVALIYNPIPTGTAKVLYSEGFRVPNIYEREYEEAGLQKINPGLKPERIRTFEFVWEQRLTRKLYSTISLYQYSMKDLIDYSWDPQDSLLLYLNIARVKARGIEWDLKARLQGGFSGYAHAAIQKAEDGITGVPLTNSPEILLGAGLTVPVGWKASAAMEFFGESERTTVYGTRTPPFLSANFNLSGFEPFPHTNLSFKIRNIFNSRYRLPGGLEHRMDSIIQDGRSFAVRFMVKY